MARVKRQTELPGMESKKIPELDTLMEQLFKQGKKISKLRTDIGETKAKVIELLEKHKVDAYKDATAVPPLIAKLSAKKSSVKVTAAVDVDDATADDAGDDDGDDAA